MSETNRASHEENNRTGGNEMGKDIAEMGADPMQDDHQEAETVNIAGGRQTRQLLLIPAALLALTLAMWLALFGVVSDLPPVAAALPTAASPEYEDLFAPLDAAVYPLPGETFGTLTIESADLEVAVMQGDSNALPKRTAGHPENAPLPGEGGRVVLNACYSSGFDPLKQVQAGDEVALNTWYGAYRYRVEDSFVFHKDDTDRLTGAGETDQSAADTTEKADKADSDAEGTTNQSGAADSDGAGAADRSGRSETSQVDENGKTDADHMGASGTETLLLYTCYPFDDAGNPEERYALLCVLIEGEEARWE